MLYLVLKIFTLVYVILVSYLVIFKKNIRQYYVCSLSVIILISFISAAGIYYGEYKGKNSRAPFVEDSVNINNYFSSSGTGNEKVLIISADDNVVGDANLEAHLSYPHNYILRRNLYKGINSDGTISFSGLHLEGFNFCSARNIEAPDYILSRQKYNLSGYSLLDKNLKIYKIYKRNNENIKINFISDGIYGDNWISKEAKFKIFGEESNYNIEIDLLLDSPYFDEVKIKCIDGTGREEYITITKDRKTYPIILHRSNLDESFSLTLSTETTFMPGGHDNRELSFRFFDITIKWE